VKVCICAQGKGKRAKKQKKKGKRSPKGGPHNGGKRTNKEEKDAWGQNYRGEERKVRKTQYLEKVRSRIWGGAIHLGEKEQK